MDEKCNTCKYWDREDKDAVTADGIPPHFKRCMCPEVAMGEIGTQEVAWPDMIARRSVGTFEKTHIWSDGGSRCCYWHGGSMQADLRAILRRQHTPTSVDMHELVNAVLVLADRVDVLEAGVMEQRVERLEERLNDMERTTRLY